MPNIPERILTPTLWSLLDMLRFRASSFATVMSGLTRATVAVTAANAFGIAQDEEADREAIDKALRDAKPSLRELPVSRVIQSQFERLESAVKTSNCQELAILVREFHNNLLVELSSAWFLMIPSQQRELYEQRQPAFGTALESAFPDATKDIAAAARCLALDESTACVFHLMRVLEHGLRSLALRVGLPPDAVSQENWKNIIDQVEKKMKELEAAPKSQEKKTKMQMYSEAAAQFRYFKDAWRNHVSHSHASYDLREAESVWRHVREFMQHIAANA
jgi:cell fate (sporulation/competence/biofilm development) regulator YlbF (YheA/YmcA/DUF963 family)